MNKKITLWLKRSFTGRILFAMSLATSLLLTACVREMEVDDAPFRPGNRATATLTFDIKTSSTDVKTRSALDAGALKLETIWIGVFDTKTGEMLGYMADRPRKSDNTRVRMNDDSGTWTVEGMDIWYYDNNPEVYIASVVNYEFVQARKVGDAETTDLHKLLGIEFDGNNIPEVTDRITWEDLCAISVDTKSIDAAMKTASSRYGSSPAEELALAMGFFNTSAGVHTTIDREGKTPANARVSLAKNGTQYVSELHPEGRIYLRRMQSDIKVNINFSATPSYDIIQEVKSLRYKVINKPVEMYLAEHAVDKSGGSLSGKDNYLSRTANSADWLGNEGYESDNEWISIDTASGSIENGYSFNYSHYENKHWGIDWELEPGEGFGYNYYGPSVPPLGYYDENDNWVADTEPRTWQGYFDEVLNRYGSSYVSYLQQGVQAMAAHRIREAKLTEGTEDELPLFKTLSQSENRAFNNNASYVLIEAEMTWKNVRDGSVAKGKYYYTIHEGYTSRADGSTVPASGRAISKNDIYDAICDFQTVRNTKYTYNLTFAGINTIRIQAMSDAYDYDNRMHDDGYTGQTWRSRGNIGEISGAGNANIYIGERGDHGGTLYYYDDPTYSYNFPEYLPLYDYFSGYEGTDYEARKQMLKFRLYETHPDEKGNSVETNYGTCSTDSHFDWIGLTGEIKSLEDLLTLPDSDPMKQFYNAIKIHVGYEVYDYSYRLQLESLFTMTLEEYINGAERDRLFMYPGTSFIYFITVDPYDTDAAIESFPDYKRAFYLIAEATDSDGCLYSEILTGAEQGPHDYRAGWEYFKPLYMQSFRYTGYNSDKFNDIYSAVQNFSHTEFIRWHPAVSYYYGKDDDSLPYEWSNYWGTRNGIKPREARSYTIYIDGNEIDTISWDSKYRHYNYTYDFENYLHVSIDTPYYFAWPYDPNDYAAGDHEIVIKANVDESVEQPVEIRTTLRLIEKPLWRFDNELYPLLGSWGSSFYYQYASMLTVYYNYMSINEGSAYWSGSYGLLYGPSYSSNDRDLFRFKLDSHGTFRINAYAPGRSVYFAYRNKNGSYSFSEYLSGTRNIYFNTRDYITNFDDGPIDVALYGYGSNMYFYEIEWIPDENQNPSYPGYIYHTTEMYDEEGNSTYIHPYYPYRYDYWYTDYTNCYYYLLTPGMTNYFGFYDTESIADQYKIEIYEYNDINNQGTVNVGSTPLLEWVFDADECRYANYDDQLQYFVCPLHIPVGKLRNDYRGYFVTVTPVSDEYIIRTRALAYGIVLPDADTATEWWDPSRYFSGYKNPWYYSSGSNYNTFQNNVGEWSEYNGLVLHGGTAGMTIGNGYIDFGGDGYPFRKSSTPEFGRYLSFTTERPGYVILNSNSGNADRYFRLYAIIDGVPVERDRKAIVVGGGPFMLSTGIVDEPTEFIICPEGGVSLSGARFVPSEDVDTRESLDNSIIAYSNWSTDPQRPIHPGMYDIIYGLEEDDEYYEYGYEYKQFPLARHFSSPISFSDSDPRATSYKLQLFYEPTFNNQNFDRPAWEVMIPADDYVTYTGDDGSKVFTYTLFFGKDCNLQPGEYLAFITPVNNNTEHFKPASPQFLTVVYYFDWTDPRPDDHYEGDPYEEIWNSPAMAWIVEYFALSQDTDDYYGIIPKTRNLMKGEYVDFMGLTLNGSGDAENTSQRNVQIVRYNSTSSSIYGDIEDWWIFFPGQGYPIVSGDSNVGTGRNLTFMTDKPGKIIIMARADRDNNGNPNRSLALYKKSGETTTLLKESKPITTLRQTSAKDIDELATLTIGTNDISGPTEFIICPKGGSSEFMEIVYFPEGCPAYDWDWENDGWPGTSDSDDDDADGQSLGRTAPFNHKSAIGLWTDRIPFPKKR